MKLEELISSAGMSRRSFLRAFEAATGCTPIAYQIQLRISRAADMLVRTTDSITNIAYDVGFNDSNYFARQSQTPRHVAADVSRSRQQGQPPIESH